FTSLGIGIVYPKLPSYVHFPNGSRFEKFTSTLLIPRHIWQKLHSSKSMILVCFGLLHY
ncbi:OLC1v1036046C1, partial [Oldenlandia corymbosa var. corymbosa]